MIRLEEKAFEETVLAEENDIAVPLEVSVTADGAVDLLVYSLAEETARRWNETPAPAMMRTAAASMIYLNFFI